MIAVVTTPALGHIKPMLPLIEGLVREGQAVTCFGHPAFADRLRATGSDFLPYPEVGYDIEDPDFNLVRLGAELIRVSDVILPMLHNHLVALRPSLILMDSMALWGSRVGTALDIPRVHTIPTMVFNAETQREMRREEGLLKLAGDVATGLPSLIASLVRSRFAVTLQEAYGVDGSWRRLAPPVHELVILLRELQFGNPDGAVPRSYVGPTTRTHRTFAPADLPPGYALITFGTLSNNRTDRFAAAMRGAFIAGLPVVVQCGTKVDARALRNLAHELEVAHPGQWAQVHETLPDMEPYIMRAGLVVHHGGLQTTWESSRYRRPQLFIPTIVDQKVVATKLHEFGVGLRLAPGLELDDHGIARGILAALAHECRWDAVETLLDASGGAERGVRIILGAARTGR